MTESLSLHTPLELRTQMHQMVVNDILGPAGGENEELDEESVRSRYIVGLLAPRGQSALPDEQDELALRRKLLARQPRHLAVLNLAAGKAGWEKPLPQGKARGIAVHSSFDSLLVESF